MLLCGCLDGTQRPTFATSTPLFAAAESSPFENRARRKWDNPVIADLDQDGLEDIIVVEHGDRVRVFWNQGGSFAAPHDIANGDLHGVAVSDYDDDLRVDVLIAQGGGDGANPRPPLRFAANADRTFDDLGALDDFEPGRGRALKLFDYDRDGKLDLVTTGFPLKTQKQGANGLYRNAGSGDFQFVRLLPQAKWLGYRAKVIDLNSDEWPDLLFYGGADIVAVINRSGSSFADATNETLGVSAEIGHVSSITGIDYDNDGDSDLFLTRSEPQFDLETYYDPDAGTFAFLAFRTEFLFSDLTVDGDLVVENLQVTYPHYDVFLGRGKRPVEFTVDRHGGKNFTVRKEDAAGWPSVREHGGLYIGYLGNGRWRIGGEARSRTAAVVRGVLEAPEPTPQLPLPARLLENRDGRFVDVTDLRGIAIDEQTTSAAAVDVDNDGWQDLVVLRYGSMATPNKHLLLLNRRGKSFSPAPSPGVTASDIGATGGTVEPIDYDRDGRVDLIFSNERGRWHLLRNQLREPGNFVVIAVGLSPAGNAPALGAAVFLSTCAHTQRRRVGATSAAFSHGANPHVHFGIGACATVDEATVTWSNGESAELKIDTVNQTWWAGRQPAGQR